MIRRHFEVGETAVTIITDEEFVPVAEESVFRSREVIQRFIRQDPLFQVTLEPYHAPDDAPPLIARMCAAGQAASVGPMAAVAGAIAEQAVVDMRAAGAARAMVDNGGDIAFLIREEARVALYAGEGVRGLGFLVQPRPEVFGMCTSSATVGPSISFGMADAATVISPNVALADACATLLGNLVTDAEDATLSAALTKVCSIPGVEGALVTAGGKVAMKGRLPEMVKAPEALSQVSRIELGYH
mgnify:CR=1 FL=1